MTEISPLDEQIKATLARRRVLVTGASGFIGRWLVARLRETEAEIHGMARNCSRLPEGIRGWAVDLRHCDAVRAAIDSIRPEFTFHLAGFVTARQDRGLVRPMVEHTFLSTVHLLNALADVQCERVVLMSSAEAPTDFHSAPKSPYAAAKASATVFASMFQRVYGLPIVTLRPSLVYGPGQPQDKLLPYIIQSLRRGSEPSLASPDRVCDFLFVRDLVEAQCLAAIQPNIDGLTIDVASRETLTIGNLMRRVAAMLGQRLEHSIATLRRLNETDLVLDTEPAARLLSWRARWTLDQGLRETLDAYAPVIERRPICEQRKVA